MKMTAANFSGFLKIIFLLHLFLSSWGMQSAYTVPTSYLFTNIVFMVVILWAIANRTSTEALGMAFLTSTVLFVIDVITLSVYWPRGTRHRLYLAFAIANTVLRPITSIVIYRIFRECDTQGEGLMRNLFGDVLVGGSTGISSANREYRGAGIAPPQGAMRTSYEPILSSDDSKP